jgi:hypothetical protein
MLRRTARALTALETAPQTATAPATPDLYARDPVGYMRRHLGLDPTAAQEQIARLLVEPPYRVLVKASHNVGKCVAWDDVITLADGARVTAGSLVGRTFSLLTLVDGRPRSVAARAEANRVEPVYRITTETGKQIVRNAAHPLWVADAQFATGTHPRITPLGWFAAGGVRVGQVVAVADELPAFGDERMSDEQVKVLAYLIGDGGYTNGGVLFSQQDNAQLAEFRACAEALGCKVRGPGPNGYDCRVTGKGGRTLTASRSPSGVVTHPYNPIKVMLKRHGLDRKHSRDKRVPAAVFRLPRRQQALFLSRLYATDGWACCAKGRGEVGFCSTSEGLVRDVQELLLRFGIHGTISRRGKVNAWVLNVLTAADLLRFAEHIGIYGKEPALAGVVNMAAAVKGVGKRWRWKQAPAGTRWEKVRSVEVLPATQTVAIEVPHHHTYLGQFWEHNSFLAAALISWWYDTFDPGAVLTTAPTATHVRDVLWREVRLQRRGLGFPGAVAPELRTAPDHYAKGITARKGEAFTGRHQERMLFVIDEAVGVEPLFWETIKTMFDGSGKHAWLCIFNPTDASSQAYQEEASGGWHVVEMSAVDHPNVLAGLRGEPSPYPGAVSLAQFREWLADWSELIEPDEATAADLQWPPQSGVWYRPGPLMESRGLGRWPSQGTCGVWSDAAWQAAVRGGLEPHPEDLPVIGCDPARFGDDYTAIHVRCGPVSLHHERHNGWPLDRTHGRLVQLARQYADWAGNRRDPNSARIDLGAIAINVDGDAHGNALLDIAQATESGCWFRAIPGSGAPSDGSMYPNRRSEGWFRTAGLARRGQLDLSRIPAALLKEIRRQAMAPVWQVDAPGRCVVEPKDVTKERLRCSPDDMDAVNLAYSPAGVDYVGYGERDEVATQSHQERTRLFRSR